MFRMPLGRRPARPMEIFTRTDLIEKAEKELGIELSSYQKEYYTNEFDEHRKNDDWNTKGFGAKLGIILTSHPGNRGFLKASVDTHKQTGYWLALAYDNYWDKARPDVDYNWIMPPRDIFDQVDTFVIPHHQSWGGVLYPYFWLLYWGMQTMGGFEYVYCANGDCILEKPENFDKLFEMIGDGDIMGIGNEDAGWSRVFNTTGFFAKTKAIQAIMKHFGERLIPFNNYVRYTQEVGNTEARFSQAIKHLGLKEIVVEKNPFNTQLHTPGGTWYDMVGFRHIHGEFNWAWKLLTMNEPYEHCIPPLIYLDRRQCSIPEQFIEYYKRTGQLVDDQTVDIRIAKLEEVAAVVAPVEVLSPEILPVVEVAVVEVPVEVLPPEILPEVVPVEVAAVEVPVEVKEVEVDDPTVFHI